MNSTNYQEIKKRLDKISPSFCAAKWNQVSIHLQNGLNHSCHHPTAHKTPELFLKEQPDSLHNTLHKMKQRKMMLEGKRPPECEYCWKVEDSNPDNVSDRFIKSAESWAEPYIEKIAEQSWDQPVNPTYVEVSFSHACNFKCMYCAPHISSSLLKEYQEHGPYQTTKYFSIENLKKRGIYPIDSESHNPYVEAFWNWWPSLVEDLKFFRITGGEPLINPNTFKFLEYISNTPRPHLNFAINTNLGIPDSQLKKFILMSKEIVQNKKIGTFEIYVSVDTHGEQAEFIRYGLNYKKFLENLELVLTELPNEVSVTIMSTYNVLSIPRFNLLLQDVLRLKEKFINPLTYTSRLNLDIPYLRSPRFQCAAVATPDLIEMIKKDVEFIQKWSIPNSAGITLFTQVELEKIKRLYYWLKSIPDDDTDRIAMRTILAHFLDEYSSRKGLNFLQIFPELENLYLESKRLYDRNPIYEDK